MALEPHPTEAQQTNVRQPAFSDVDLERHPGGRSYWWVWLLVFAGIAYGCYRLYTFENGKQAERGGAKMAAMRPHNPSVVVAAAQRGNMPVYLQGLGTVTAFNTVTVRPRVDGQLINVTFHEGQNVNKGDLLAELDPRTYSSSAG